MSLFRKLFKVRQPGNGQAFENSVKAAANTSRAMKPTEATSPNRMGGVKKAVKV